MSCAVSLVGYHNIEMSQCGTIEQLATLVVVGHVDI